MKFEKGQRWRSRSSVIYVLTSIRHNGAVVYGRQELPNGKLASAVRLGLNASHTRDWTLVEGERDA